MLVGEFLPPYFISQLEDSIIISGSFNFGDFRFIYAWEIEVDDAEVSSYRLLFTIPYPAQHELKLIGFTKDKEPIVEASKFSITYSAPVEGSPHSSDAFRNSSLAILASLNCGAWVSATNYVIAFGGTVSGCLGDIDNFLIKGKLDHIVAIVKSCSPNILGDLNVTLKDLSGTIPGTIHHKVIDEAGYGKDITVGAAMILKNISVCTPKPSEHYLNITMRNVFKVFRKDTVLGSGTG
ncbi:transposase, MuDR, MULE transposase domain protein [Tanacetum coccineum]